MLPRKLALALACLLVVVVLVGLIQGTPVVAGVGDVPNACAEWSVTFGGSNDDRGAAVAEVSDGGFAVAGATKSYGGGTSAYLVRLDSAGAEVWHRIYDESEEDLLYDVEQTAGGGFVLAGSTCVDGKPALWVMKTDNTGAETWDFKFNGVGWSKASSVMQVADGGYVVTGWINSADSNLDVLLVKLSSAGSMEWSKTYGGTGADQGHCVIQTYDGGFVIAGETYSLGAGSSDVYLLKVNDDTNKTVAWQRVFGGTGVDVGYSVQETADQGFIIGGTTYTKTSDYDMWLIKTDKQGLKQWDKTFGGTGCDKGYSTVQTWDGGYILVGETSSLGSGGADAWLIKTDSAGNQKWAEVFGGLGKDIGWQVRQTFDRGYIIAGETSSFGGGDADIWAIKVSNPPATPTNQAPANNAVGVSVTPQLRSSAFADPDSGDTAGASHWQISSKAGDYSSPVFDSGPDAANLTSITVEAGKLAYDTVYFWRVRHRDNHGAWSAFSSETTFKTTQIKPSRPVNSAPADGATGVSATPTLRCSAFFDLEPEDTHAASHWQITSTPGSYTGCAFDSGADTTNLVSLTVPSGRLEYESTYYWRVRHQDSDGNLSDWSQETSFATSERPPAPVASFTASPREGSAPLKVQFTSTSTGVITSYSWVFQSSEGTVTNATENPAIQFPKGTYSVSLTVTGPGGSNTKTENGYITVGGSSSAGSCGGANIATASAQDLVTGWGITGICLGSGYYFVRTTRRKFRK